MNKVLGVVVLCGLLTGCAGVPPAIHQVQNSFSFDRPFDQVWQAVIEVFAEMNLPISNMEKASGLIVTDWINFSGQNNTTGYCDCGKPRFPLGEAWRHGKFNIYVKSASDAVCEVKINVLFEALHAYGQNSETVNCPSTGILEAEIYKRVQEKLK